ncbi:MAG: threonylcarbamoyl-AMP synthase [Candidatus Altiarchaeales archaeon]|nr:MAG: threonylcarbamoyl-AMP synthase [Candidatus Altiarchaeales archaeon]RLI93657.1 MAG: threonylcarbamoyl-AMP synthase [Candidatus Altiarchaeales archaeon]HDO82619.1 threonylcarbamoyl-AMP synthase [Candidatus Altiarchaeales archaeon]HEX55268.1 threonylcarbamoyl-AMP synthase [Candidatus Altiarchaeales archaeon]
MILRINPDNPEKDLVTFVSNEIRNGKVIIYPTDTVYGLGCSIYSENVRRIFDIKKRDLKNPLSIAFSDLDMLKKYVILNKEEERFIRENINDPYTFVVRKRHNIPDIITAGREKVGVRIPNLRLTREVIRHAKVPIITTSANISGEKAPSDFKEIDDRIKRKVDLLIDSGRCKIGTPSRVIDLETMEILRY